MKHLLFAVATASFFFISCDQTKVAGETKDNPAVQKNLDASHVISKAFETGDVSKLDSVVSPDYVDHSDRGDLKGVDSLKAMVKWIKTSFTDMKMEVKKEWADEEYVNIWTRYSGNNPNGAGGMPAGPYDFQAIELIRFKDGKAIEHWGFLNGQDMAKMMQPPSQMNNMQPKDTAKHQ